MKNYWLEKSNKKFVCLKSGYGVHLTMNDLRESRSDIRSMFDDEDYFRKMLFEALDFEKETSVYKYGE